VSEFVRVANLRDLPAGNLLGVELAGKKVVLANVEGSVYALEGICTHQDALLAEGSLYEECLMCPIHGGEFDARTGEAITLPAMEALRTYEVRLEDGEILLAGPRR